CRASRTAVAVKTMSGASMSTFAIAYAVSGAWHGPAVSAMSEACMGAASAPKALTSATSRSRKSSGDRIRNFIGTPFFRARLGARDRLQTELVGAGVHRVAERRDGLRRVGA